jgi:hypothetical protein
MAPCAGLVVEFALVTFKSAGGKYHGCTVLMQGTKFILSAAGNRQPVIKIRKSAAGSHFAGRHPQTGNPLDFSGIYSNFDNTLCVHLLND